MIPRLIARTALAVVVAAGTVGVLGTAASADAGGCPAAAGWTRVAVVPAGTTSVTVEAPAGSGIVETCLWTGTDTQVYAYDPAASSVVIAPVGVPAEGEPALTLVEYAYRLIALEPVPAEPAPTPTPTPPPAPAPVAAPAPAPQPAAAASRPTQRGAPAAAPAAALAEPTPAEPTPATAPVTEATTAPPVLGDAAFASVTPMVEVDGARTSAVVRAPASITATDGGDHANAGLAASIGVALLAAGAAVVAAYRRRPAGLATD